MKANNNKIVVLFILKEVMKMLILIISIVVLAVGIVFIRFTLKNQKYDSVECMGAILSAIGGFSTVVFIVMTIMSHTNVGYQFQRDYIEYEILQEQIDSGNYNSTTITSDIISYNQKVMDNKRYYNSPWVGLYYYEGCEKLPLLEIKDKKITTSIK